MLLCTLMIYILYSLCLEGCNTNNGILELLGFISLGVAVWLLVWERKPTFSCLSSSLQSSVPVSYVRDLSRYGLNFHMIGFMEFHHIHFTPCMYQDHMGPWDHFWSHWFQFWGATSNIGDSVTTWEDYCNKSSVVTSIVIPL